jgi:hypothetical protein
MVDSKWARLSEKEVIDEVVFGLKPCVLSTRAIFYFL